MSHNSPNLSDRPHKLIILIILVILIGVTAALIYLQTGSRPPEIPVLSAPGQPALNTPRPRKSLAEQLVEKINPPSATPSPRPTPAPILQGKETYSIGQASDAKGPKITQAVFEPHDPAVGQTQKITIKTSHSQPVTAVELVIKSDNKTQTQNLTLASGTAADGSWSASWTVNDTHLYIYVVTVKAKSTDGESAVDISIR